MTTSEWGMGVWLLHQGFRAMKFLVVSIKPTRSETFGGGSEGPDF